MTPALIGVAGAVLVAVITWLLTLRGEWFTRKIAQRQLEGNLRAVQGLLNIAVQDEPDENEPIRLNEDQAERLALPTWTDAASRAALHSHLTSSTTTAIEDFQRTLTRAKNDVRKPANENAPHATVTALKARASAIDDILTTLKTDNKKRYKHRTVIATIVVVCCHTPFPPERCGAAVAVAGNGLFPAGSVPSRSSR